MIRKLLPRLLICTGMALSCTPSRQTSYQVTPSGEVRAETATMDFFEQLLREEPQLRPFLDQKEAYKIQIIYTQINRDAQNRPHFSDFYFNVNPAHYFYPASTVKMPAAILAMEKMAALEDKGINIHSTMITGAGTAMQTPVYNDPLTPDGRPSLASYIRKIFLVSDNNAYNRVYEFLGQQYFNQQLRAKGHKEAEIIHRLQISLPEEENRKTNPIRFYDTQGNLRYEQPLQYNTEPHFNRRDSLGSGYIRSGKLVASPMDFSTKNRIALASLHGMLRAILFPGSVPASERIQIKEEDRRWLIKTMGEFPTESRFPPYPGQDTAGNKILFYGDGKTDPILPGLRIFNKTGGAYGFLLDITYMADLDRHVEFMLSAVIYCNSDGILNDDRYDYQNAGYPFMRALGRKVYAYELGRRREHKPDLSEFRMGW